MDDNYSKLSQLRQALPHEELLREKLAILNKKPKTDLEVYNELSANNPELAAIAMIESSGGKDYSHDPDPKSGMTAGGMFGMMPRTASDIIRLDSNLAARYPEMAEYTQNLDASHPKITEFFNTNPEAAAEFALSHYNRVKKRLGNEDEVPYSWFNGVTNTLKARKIPGKIQNHDYVKKFRQYLQNKKEVAKK